MPNAELIFSSTEGDVWGIPVKDGIYRITAFFGPLAQDSKLIAAMDEGLFCRKVDEALEILTAEALSMSVQASA